MYFLNHEYLLFFLNDPFLEVYYTSYRKYSIELYIYVVAKVLIFNFYFNTWRLTCQDHFGR